MFNGGKMKERQEKYNNIEPLPKKKKSKRKMALDSDEEDDGDDWSEYQDEDD